MMFLVTPVNPAGHSEKLLLAALIRRAAYDVILFRGKRELKYRSIWEDAHNWLFKERGKSVEREFCSFENICFLLDQDPEEIRRKTLRLTKQDVRKYDIVDPHGRI